MLLQIFKKIFLNISCCFQGWRITYYGAGVIALIIAILTGLTLVEPERKSIGEDAAAQASGEAKKVSIWKIILEPRVVFLCLAASIRHCGKSCEGFYAKMCFEK